MFLLFYGALLVSSEVCAPSYTISDPNSGNSYTYNLNDAANTVITAVESGQDWKLFVDICGNASPKGGCSIPTPLCQSDLGNSFNCGGSNGNWTVGAYYEPSNPGNLIYDGGVVVIAGGGDACMAGTVARTTSLFLKCDPSIASLPSTPITVVEPNVCQVSSFDRGLQIHISLTIAIQVPNFDSLARILSARPPSSSYSDIVACQCIYTLCRRC